MTLRRAADLVRAGLVAPAAEAELAAVAARYAVAVPPLLAGLIAPGDAADPIGLQVLPDAAELHQAADEAADPIGDHAHAPLPGIVHRYPDRVLLTPAFSCAVYCRFCFRRERVGPSGDGGGLSPAELAAALA